MILRVFFILAMAFANPVYAGTACQSLFENTLSYQIKSQSVDFGLKKGLIESAIKRSNISLHIEPKVIERLVSKWKLEKSTPAKIERLAQTLVSKDENTERILIRLRNFFTKENTVKDLVKVRVHTLLLKRELIYGLETLGYLKPNTKFDQYRQFRQKYYNVIQAAKFIGINAATMKYLGMPIYFPFFDQVKNIEFKAEELDMVQQRGFEAVYKTIAENYKARLYTQRALEHMPQAFVLSIGMMVSYNYFKIKNIENRYEITVENPIPQSHVLYLAWKESFIEKNGREPNLKNAQDRRGWDLLVQSVYRAWADMYQQREGRYPDLSKEQDRLAWEQFLETVVE